MDHRLCAETVKQWRAGHEEANRLDLEEARSKSPEERLRNLQAFMENLATLGLLRERVEDDALYERWQLIRERWLARGA